MKTDETDKARDPEPEPPTGHEWQFARFTGAMTCGRCGLLPLDSDDWGTPCAGRK